MKKIFTLFIYAFFLSSILFAQTAITLTVDDIADAGDIYVVSNGNPLEDYSLDYTGENIVWNYNFLTPVTQDSVVWLEPTETNVAYFLLWFVSNIAEESAQVISSDLFSIEDIFNFYNRSGSELAIKGFAGTVEGIPLPAAYDSPDKVYEFPITYGSDYNSNSSFTFGIPGYGSWAEEKERTCDADGWGTVITPFGEFETVRLHCEIAVSDVFEYSGFEIPISYTSHEYRWLSPDMGIPVLQINTQALLGFETVTQVIYQDTLLPAPVSIQENLLHADITLQNPVSNTMQIAIQAEQAYPMYLIVKDTKGATVLETKQEILNTGINNFSYSINNLESGMYLVNVVMDNRVVEVKKLIVLK
ncbi:MAG: hypothetical protein KBH39_02385 [Chitinophagales bacterium]|nr:hypothetical protein [Chitinophagales bacterium]